MRDDRFGKLVDTVDAIARSPLVKHFVIGYTKRSLMSRDNDYWKDGWDDAVVLTDCMKRKEALDLESELFDEICRRSPKNSIIYRKYDPSRRIGGPRRSDGGADPATANDRIHKVYMAWTHIEGNHRPPKP